MAATDLSDAAIDLESSRSAARDAILSALDARPGRKALVMDPLFAPTLTSLCTMSELTEHAWTACTSSRVVPWRRSATRSSSS
jgi:hypothetical protein